MSINNAFLDFPVLETDRLVLRRILLSDAKAIFKILSGELVTQFYDDDPFIEFSQAQEQIAAWDNGFKQQWALRWGIAFKNDSELIGTCGFYGVHSLHLRAEIGYELASSHWRQGIMTEALMAIIKFGFEKMELNRIQASVMLANIASIKLLEKLGFKNEGLLAQYENWGSKGNVNYINERQKSFF